MKKHIGTTIGIIAISIVLIGCGSNKNLPGQLGSSSSGGQGIKVPTAIPLNKITSVQPSQTSPVSGGLNNSGHEWKVTPFMVGEIENMDAGPGWKYYAVYLAIENTGKTIDTYIFSDNSGGWVSEMSNKVEPSYPSIVNAYIKTDGGYEYPPKNERPMNVGYLSSLGYPLIGGSNDYYYPTDQIQGNSYYFPLAVGWPPIPPGFRYFVSIPFKVATNTTGLALVLPDIGEYPFDKLNHRIDFPYDDPPDYLQNLSEQFTLSDNSELTVKNFSRSLEGTATLDLSIKNPTGYDYNPANYRIYIFDNFGRLVIPSTRLDLTTVGPGQEMTFSPSWNISPLQGDLFLLITHDANFDAQGNYNVPWWALFELKKDAALQASYVLATATAQATATVQAENIANEAKVKPVKDFIRGVLSGSSAIVNQFYKEGSSQAPGSPQDSWDFIGQGTKYSPLDVMYLMSCFDLIPIDTVFYNIDEYSGNIWLSEGKGNQTFKAIDGTDQSVVFYVRGYQPDQYLEAIFVSGCTAPPAPPTGWVYSGLKGETISDISISKDTIYVATNSASHGIFKSDDGGTSWKAVNNGLENLNILQVEASYNDPNLVYSVDGGLWRSEDGGASWINLNPPDQYFNFSYLAIDTDNGAKLLWRIDDLNLGISSNNGGSWQFDRVGSNTYETTMRVAPSDRNVVYLFRRLEAVLAGDFNADMSRYNLGSNQWFPLANAGLEQPIQDLAVSYQNAIELYVATPNGIYRSSDSGGSWTPMNNTLPNQGNDLNCTKLVTSPWTVGEVFAICNRHIYHTTDAGTTWTSIESPVGVRILELMPDTKILVAGTEKYGLYLYKLP